MFAVRWQRLPRVFRSKEGAQKSGVQSREVDLDWQTEQVLPFFCDFVFCIADHPEVALLKDLHDRETDSSSRSGKSLQVMNDSLLKRVIELSRESLGTPFLVQGDFDLTSTFCPEPVR